MKIVYCSNTGYTAQYAQMLSQETGLTAIPYEEAKKSLSKSDEVLFMSWLMAGQVTEYKKASKAFNIKAVAAVGLCETGTIADDVRKSNSVPQSVSVFTLQGGYAPQKLKGIYKFLMKIVTKVLIKKIDSIPQPKESDLAMKKALINGGTFVSKENLKEIIEFLK